MSGGVLFSPHNDDEALFAAFTILRYRPAVVVCYPSVRDYGDPVAREAETRQACQLLGASAVYQWTGGDLFLQMRAYDEARQPAQVWAPHEDTSHPEHVAVALAARTVFGARVVRYHTYRIGAGLYPFKVRDGRRVEPEPGWARQKIRALACYESQLAHGRAWRFFMDDLHEYLGD